MKKICFFLMLICFSIGLVAHDVEDLTNELGDILQYSAAKYDDGSLVKDNDLHLSSLSYGGPDSLLLNKFLEEHTSKLDMTLFDEALKYYDHDHVVKALEVSYQLPHEHVLYTAIRLKDLKILAAVLINLLKHKKINQINDAISYGTIPLFFALYMKNFNAIPIFLKLGADPAYGLRDLRYSQWIVDEGSGKWVQSFKDQTAKFYRDVLKTLKIFVASHQTSLPDPVIDEIIYYVFFQD